MSSSIKIPTGSSKAGHHRHASKAAESSSGSSYSSSSSSECPSAASSSPSSNSKQKSEDSPTRRPRLLSSALSKEECTVINIGSPDGPPRLISYLSSSQGFIWNPEIFLPSYVDCDYVPLENRRDPVHEIYLTDEEVQKMFPE
ncbi:hypothetical protein ESCO_002806 [Escovopsis weberi]|uniref:Uncharacterized protein n=1 Tax=Escovopsis weberi TaxID=150374 RepID=A0A0M9VSU5_ESCWE|nr:hypothetical protein ESCO_002806 [Escovopsis weberi]